MEGSVEARVSHEVDLWMRWLPKWQPGTHRARMRLCRVCFGSPVIAAAGLVTDVPHAVQHSMSMRMKLIVDAAVDEYTARNLPTLHRELEQTEQRKRQAHFRPGEGLAPEATGLELDPEPEEGQPFLFTFGELAAASAAEAAGASAASDEAPGGQDFALWDDVSDFAEPLPDVPAVPPASPVEPPPLTEEQKKALRAELALADEYASEVGRRVCVELAGHRRRIAAGIAEFIEPQVAALLADLDRELDSPFWPSS